jgi:hypothetical protein
MENVLAYQIFGFFKYPLLLANLITRIPPELTFF